jgi:hypothetical protein
MSDFLKEIQFDILETARGSFGQTWTVEELRPSLKELRESYSLKTGPDFSNPMIRLAYSLASHPYHALMSYEMFSQCAHVLKARRVTEFSATLLGAGPGAEAIALVRLLAAKMPDLEHITLTLVDKESGWSNTRRTTIEKTSRRWWQGKLTINEITADLATDEGRETAIEALKDVDLVVAQAVLTEIFEGQESVHLLADVVNHFGSDSLLLLCDFTRMTGLENWVAELDELESMRTVLAIQQRFPMPTCHPDVKPLYVNEDYLRERGQVTVTARLYSRPGWQPPVVHVNDEFLPTQGQQEALTVFAEFINNDSANAFILEGPAGTGKTEIMRRMAAICTSQGFSVHLWAPTGQAAVRLAERSGLPTSTIHSGLFERTGHRDNDTNEREWPPTIVFSRRDINYSRSVVFVDEASMIDNRQDIEGSEPPELKFEDGRLLTHILKGVIGNNGKVVFIGDSCQLPPIEESFAIALNEKELTELGCHVVTASLTEVRRTTANSDILNFSNRLRERVLSGENSITTVQPDLAGDISLTTSFDLPPFLLEEFRTGDAIAVAVRNIDVANSNSLIRQSLNISSELPVLNERLVLVKGNQILGLLNGTEIRVRRSLGDVLEVSLRRKGTNEVDVVRLQEILLVTNLDSGDELEFEATIVVDTLFSAGRELLATIRRVLWVDFLIRMKAVGLTKNHEEFWKAYEKDPRANALVSSFSYARTVHRAQGGEWKSIYVDVHSMLPERSGTPRQAYSAVTRAKQALYLRGWPRAGVEPLTHEYLADGPVSILQQALKRRFTFRSLKNAVTAVQLYTEDDASNLLVNVFEGKRGITVHLDRATPQESQTVQSSLDAWAKWEWTRRRHEVPVRLEATMNLLEARLTESEIDFIVVKPGNANREIELHAFSGSNFASFRSNWTDSAGLTLRTFTAVDFNSESLRDYVLGQVHAVLGP